MSLKNSVNVVRNWNFRSGGLLDRTGNSTTATVTNNVLWSGSNYGRGLRFDGDTGKVDMGISGVGTGDITWVGIVKLNSRGESNAARIFSNGSFEVSSKFQNGIMVRSDGSTEKNSAADIVYGKDFYHVAVVRTSAGLTTIYIDGVVSGTADESSGTPVAAATNDFIGNIQAGTKCMDGCILEQQVYNTLLSSQDIGRLVAEWRKEAHIGTLPKRNFQYPQVIGNGEFTRDVLWTKGTGWSIANAKASSDGSQSADSDLTQAVGVVGRTYTIEYKVSNYSAGSITALAGATEGTDRSADGVYTEVLTQTTNSNIGVRADLDFVGDIDWVKISEGNLPVYKNDFSDAPVSLGATDGNLNDFMPSTGTWKISEDGTDKWLECVTSGVVYTPSIQSYGTWQWDVYKGSDDSAPFILFMADTIGGQSATGQDGYNIVFSGTESVNFGESTNGSAVAKFTTAASYIAIQTKYTIRVTRDYTGEFSVYIRGGAFTNWQLVDVSGGTGTNPFTDTTAKNPLYTCLDFDAGDKITNIKFWQGVLDPTA